MCGGYESDTDSEQRRTLPSHADQSGDSLRGSLPASEIGHRGATRRVTLSSIALAAVRKKPTRRPLRLLTGESFPKRMMNSIRVGIVGAGQNTCARHIPGLRDTGCVQIVSVCNRRRESAERAAAQFDIPKVVDQWEDLVADDDIDAVVIGAWPNLHCPVTLAALAADKHVLCEARIAKSAAEARKMLAAARDKPDLIAQVVPAPMTLEVDNTVSRHLADGYLGNLLAVRLVAGGTFLAPNAPLHWRQNREISGNNIMSLGIWYECLMRWVGPAVNVFARGTTFVKQRRGDDGVEQSVEIPEHLDVVATLTNNIPSNLQISSVAGLDDAPSIWLFGSDATLRFAGGQLHGGRRGEKQLAPISIPKNEAIGWRVEAEFIGAIQGEAPITRTTFDDGVRYMEFTDAVWRSLKSSRLAEVPPL